MADINDLFTDSDGRGIDDLFETPKKPKHVTDKYVPTGDSFMMDNNPYAGEVADAFWKHSIPGRVLSAFGQGAAQGWGAGSDPKVREKVAKNEDYVNKQKDWSETHKYFSKAFNTTFLRPASTVFDAAAMYGSKAFGAVVGAGAETIKEGSTILNEGAEALDKVPEDSIFKPTAALASNILTPTAEVLGHTVGAQAMYTNPFTGKTIPLEAPFSYLPESVRNPQLFVDRAIAARAYGWIGEGEEGFFNTTKVTPENLAERQQAALESKQRPAALDLRPPQNDVATLAREIDPGTYKELDRLKDKQEALKLSIQNELAKRQVAMSEGMAEGHPKLKKNMEGVQRLQENLLKTEEELVNIKPKVVDAERRTGEMLDANTPEGAAFRDYIQIKLLERQLEVEAKIARDHADSLIPKPLPTEKAQEQLKVVEQVEKENAKVKETEGPNAKPVAEVVEKKEPTAASTGEPSTYLGAKPVEGVGDTKTRGLARTTEERAVAQGLVDSIGDLPEYKALNLEDQARRAVGLIEEDFNRAKRVAMGHEAPPDGLNALSVYYAVRKRAEWSGDIDLIRNLAVNSELNKRLTTAGQDLRIAREAGEDFDTSAVNALAAITEHRQKINKAKLTDEAFKTGEILKTYIEKATHSVDDAIAFIRSIQCDT